METPDVTIGAPSAPPPRESALPPAVAAAVVADDFKAFQAAERAEKPKPPTLSAAPSPATTTKAVPSPAQPVEQAAQIGASSKPASEPAPQEKEPSRKLPRNASDNRIDELLAERAQLRRELDLARQPQVTTKPASEPAPAAAKPEKFPDYAEYLAEHPDAPLSEYLDARDDWRDTRREAERIARETGDALERSLTERVESFHQQFTDVLKTNPDFMDSIHPDVANAKPREALKPGERVTPQNIIASELMKSSCAPKLMTYWTEHPEVYQRLQQVPERYRSLPPALQAREHVNWIVREIGKLEAALEAPAAPSTTPPKTVSSAPAPPTTLGTRPSAPADPSRAAVEADDVRAFREAEKQKRLARMVR